ncbi:MAG TPA: VanW family protein [Polyangiaceae bacterium]|nr:VanW family protein [Polyangiaceae bacterium]
MRKWGAALLVLLGAGLAIGVLATLRWLDSSCYWTDAICPGVRVAGEILPASADIDVLLSERARALSARSLEVSVAGVSDEARAFTLGELGVVLDVARTASLVHAVGHSGSCWDRWAHARMAERGEVDVPLEIDFDGEGARALLMPLKDATDEFPVPARLDLAHGGVVPDRPGHFLDLDDAVEQIRRAVFSGEGKIALRRLDVRAQVSREFLDQVDTREQLSRFQTFFSRAGDQENRAKNIDNAAAKLDGVVLLPHELFSFNAVVGPRTVENGFAKGWEIFKGEMVEGIGGGTCQVASTLHAAAFLAGLDVIERLPHSRPSAYITMGLDATVVYPLVDLKLRNPYDFPIAVHSHAEGGTVVFELLGRDRPARVTFGRQVLATRPFTRKVEEMPGLAANRVIRKQHGIRGYKILRTRTIAFANGTAHRESNVDIYPPTIEMYLVAPGTDPEAALPPLPEDLAPASPSGWSPFTPPTSAPLLAAAPPAAALGAPGTIPCADCPPERPKIIEAPGVHAPRAEQLRAPGRVVIGTGH